MGEYSWGDGSEINIGNIERQSVNQALGEIPAGYNTVPLMGRYHAGRVNMIDDYHPYKQ